MLFPPALQNPSAWAFSAFCVPFSSVMPLACCAPKAGCSSLRLAKIHQRWSFHPSACLFLRSRLWLAASPRQGALPSGSPKSVSVGLFSLLRAFFFSFILCLPGAGDVRRPFLPEQTNRPPFPFWGERRAACYLPVKDPSGRFEELVPVAHHEYRQYQERQDPGEIEPQLAGEPHSLAGVGLGHKLVPAPAVAGNAEQQVD